VTKLIQTGTNGGKPEFESVEFATEQDGASCSSFYSLVSSQHLFSGQPLSSAPRTVVTARNEIILSAGATNTPQILLLSGLGSASQLRSVGIEPILDLPAVGANLIDHVLACPTFSVNTTLTYDDVLRNATVAAETLQQWNTTMQGQYVDGVANQLGWLKVPQNESIWNEVTEDPSSGPTAANYELFFSVSHENDMCTFWFIHII
jgi:choline dehydrogenase-like flavoprotein